MTSRPTQEDRTTLRLATSRRSLVSAGLHVSLFFAFYYGTPFPTGRPFGSDAAGAIIVAGAVLRSVVYALARVHQGEARWDARVIPLFRGLVLLVAAAWGLLAIPTVHQYGLEVPTFILFTILLGFAMLAIPYFGLDLPLVRALVVVFTLPAGLAVVARAEPGSLTLGWGCLVWTAFLFFLSGQAHETLREALASRAIIQGHRDQLSAVLDAFPGFVLWTDEAGKILGVNDELARTYGDTSEGRIGRPFDEVLPDERLCAAIRAFAAAPTTERVDELQLSGPRGLRWALLALKKYGAPSRPQLLVTGLDVEGKKRAERERDEAQASAYRASRLAELGVMAAGIAHEINNPLQALRYTLDLLKQQLEAPTRSHEELAAKTLPMVERGAATVQRIASIIQTLRAFAREDRAPALELVDVRDVVRDVHELGASLRTADEAELHLEVPEEQLLVHARRGQLGQVLLSLVNNARDAVRSAPDKRIVVRAQAVGDAVELSVEDSGPGVPGNIRDKIMVPFFTTKGVGGGTGLGLSIARAIVEENAGSLYLDTAARETRFVVRLPRASAP